MPGSHHKDAVVKRHQAPKMLLVLQKLRRQTGVSKTPRNIPNDRHGKKRDRHHIWQDREEELIEVVRVIHKRPPGRSGIEPAGAAHPGSRLRAWLRWRRSAVHKHCREELP